MPEPAAHFIVPDTLCLLLFRRGLEQHHCEERHLHVGQERPSHTERVSQDVDRSTGLWANMGSMPATLQLYDLE